jgi:hypothetical protein
VLGTRLALFLHKLVALSTPFQAVQNEVAVLKRGQDIASPHSIAGTNGGSSNEPVKWGYCGSLHFPLEDRFCGHAMLTLRQG